MDKTQVEFDIKLAKIGMVFGASVAIGITIAGVGIALIAERSDTPYYFGLGLIIESIGIIVITCVTLVAHNEINNLKNKVLQENESSKPPPTLNQEERKDALGTSGYS